MNKAKPVYPASTVLLVSACFFLSGLAGLVYEVVWARQLSLFLGITSYAHTVVIVAYMAGLAAGSFYFGRHADRQPHPLKTYAWLEIGVGLYAAVTPWLFTFLQAAYVNFSDVSSIGQMSGYLTRFAIALLALLIPTFLMGGTLPLLVRGLIKELPDLGQITGRLYGINTLGAMLGALLAGFLLMPALGIHATIWVGVVINLAIAVLVLTRLEHLKPHHLELGPATLATGQPPVNAQPSETSVSQLVLLTGFATAGFAALLTQMAWIRALILVVGGSVYAFSITLASFLAGIGLGSLVYTRSLAKGGGLLPSWLPNRMALAALLAVLISLTLLLGLPLIGRLPAWFLAGYSAGLKDSFALFQLFIFLLCFSLMILPTLLMGAMFPLVTVIWTRSFGRVGRGVGLVYAVNTSGTILGALLGGLLILPWLGVHYSILLAAGMYFLVATGFWLSSTTGLSRPYRNSAPVVALLLLVVVALLIPQWNRSVMMSGVFSRPDNMMMVIREQPDKSLQQIIDEYELLYYEEGADATVAVRRKKGNASSQRTLVINGKADASSAGDMPTQILLAQLPVALNPEAENALVIGLGSGITAGSLATREALESLTILEISSEVVEASAFFEPENNHVLKDPRVRLETADARNYLMASDDRYDLIISEPSNPWISGIANLFTDEFLKLAKRRLRDGGVMTQWFHIYAMSDADLKTMLKTFDDNFKHVSVWRIQSGDLALIGSDQPHGVSLAYATGDGAGEFARANIGSARELAGLYVFGGDALSRYARGSKTNSDNYPVVEFNAPRNLYSLTEKENMDNIFAYLKGAKQTVPLTDMVFQSEDVLDAPFMSLRIDSAGQTPRQVNASWLIDRQMVPLGRTMVAGLGSERLLAWTEGQTRFQVRAVWLSTATSQDSLQDLLKQSMASTGRQGGQTRLGDGVDAIWLSNRDEKSSPMQLDIAWDCPVRESGFTRYALHTSLPNPEPQSREKVISGLTGKFSCY